MTIDIRSILCPQDRSDTSGTALAYASMLAQWYGADLTVLEMIWVAAPPRARRRGTSARATHS